MKSIILSVGSLVCLFLLTACPARLNLVIANQSSNTIEIMHPDGISDAILQSGDIKKTAFPASTPKRPNVRLVYIKIENKVFIYEFSALPDPASRISSGFMEDGKVRVIFHEDKKIYIIPNKANWEDAMQKYKQPVGWPVFPTAEPN